MSSPIDVTQSPTKKPPIKDNINKSINKANNLFKAKQLTFNHNNNTTPTQSSLHNVDTQFNLPYIDNDTKLP